MCGIAGVLERGVRSARALEETARGMAAPLVHRGPDAGGVWTDADAGVGFGHRRLSVIDLSPAGAQPMVSACGRFVISYNGEAYNAAELRAELEARGARLRGHSDTEAVLEACAAWGVEAAARRLIGMFAFALWDRAGRRLHLVRDRMGIKPLYWCATPERFSFASELTGLRAHPAFEAEIDRDAVDAFLALDYIPAPHSIWRGVSKLEPGTVLSVAAGTPDRVEIAPYWTLADAARKGAADRFAGSFEDAADELERLLSDAVERRMIADVPLGAFLSGGIDSSTVVALMQRHSPRPVKTFTIGFSNGAFDEAPHARAVARHLGTDHHEHYVTPDEIRQHGPAIMAHVDEPLSEPSLLQSWVLCRMARRQVTVALSGDGGDELFGGYPRHFAAERIVDHPAHRFGPLAQASIRHVVPSLPRILRKAVRLMPRMRDGRSAPLSNMEIMVLARTLHDPALVHHALAHGDFDGPSPRGRGPEMDRIDAWLRQTGPLSASERQQFIDAAGYLPDYLLARYDRMSMAVSLEIRVPILDHRIVEFAYSLPPAMKVQGTRTKRILRDVLGRHVPEVLFERAKRGFGAPFALWLKGPLRGWARDLMHEDSVRRHGILDPKAARAIDRRLRAGVFRRPDFRRLALAAWCEANL